MQRLFITGIPTAGKSYLGKRLAEEVGGIYVSLDDCREKWEQDKKYKKWINFYWNQNEIEYFNRNTYKRQWKHLIKQSNALWPAILKKLVSMKKNNDQLFLKV